LWRFFPFIPKERHELNKDLAEQLRNLQPGDLVKIEWFDASTGKSLAAGEDVDLPVKSFGIYVAILGRKNKHIVLAHNCFEFSNGLYDVDYTSIPLTWTLNITVKAEQELSSGEAVLLLKSFLAGRSRRIKRRTRNHAYMD